MKNIILKFIYTPIINFFLRPLAKLIHRFTSKQMLAISGEMNFKIREQKIKIESNPTSYVAKELFYNKAINYEFTDLFLHILPHQKSFLDIGANFGYFSLVAAKFNPSCKILAFEPANGAFHYLEKNIALNRLSQIIPIKKAISKSTGNLIFNEVTNKKYPWLKYNLNGSNSLDSNNIRHDFQSYEVEVTTIEKSIENYQLENLDLIKLDTECTENEIFKASISSFQKYRPIIISEIYAVIEAEIQEIYDTTFESYALFQYSEITRKLKEIKQFSEVDPTDFNRNFIFCPTEKRSQISLFIQ